MGRRPGLRRQIPRRDGFGVRPPPRDRPPRSVARSTCTRFFTVLGSGEAMRSRQTATGSRGRRSPRVRGWSRRVPRWRNSPAERLRPETAQLGVVPSLHVDLNKPRCHADDASEQSGTSRSAVLISARADDVALPLEDRGHGQDSRSNESDGHELSFGRPVTVTQDLKLICH